MHISEGVLSPAVLGGGWALTVAGTALGLRRLDYDRLMTVAILAAAALNMTVRATAMIFTSGKIPVCGRPLTGTIIKATGTKAVSLRRTALSATWKTTTSS